jgi:hypothetical protein
MFLAALRQNGVIANRAAKGPAGEAGMQRLLDDLFTAHSIDIDNEPTPHALDALQRLLDGVPERWRDADLAWWPACATEMWSAR